MGPSPPPTVAQFVPPHGLFGHGQGRSQDFYWGYRLPPGDDRFFRLFFAEPIFLKICYLWILEKFVGIFHKHIPPLPSGAPAVVPVHLRLCARPLLHFQLFADRRRSDRQNGRLFAVHSFSGNAKRRTHRGTDAVVERRCHSNGGHQQNARLLLAITFPITPFANCLIGAPPPFFEKYKISFIGAAERESDIQFRQFYNPNPDLNEKLPFILKMILLHEISSILAALRLCQIRVQ